MDREKVFTERERTFNKRTTELSKRYNAYSIARVTLFIVAILLAIFFANARLGIALFAVALVFPLCFGWLVNRHNRIAKKRSNYRYLAEINKDESLRLAGEIKSFPEGVEYQKQQHAYAKDMDVFGRNSVYQLVNRANTPSGKETLANWLNVQPTLNTIVERQQAVVELKDQLDWRQQFQASGMSQDKEAQKFNSVIKWLNSPAKIKYDTLTKALAWLLPIAMISLISLNIFADLSIYYTIALAVINSLVLKKYAYYVSDITESTSKGLKTLKAYGQLISVIEKKEFESNYLKKLKEAFVHDEFRASKAILQLQRILEFLHGRANMFYMLFNVILLFDIHLLIRAERWKEHQHDDVSIWFDRIGAFESLNSLAGFAFANPEYVMPKIETSSFVLKATKLGHPLIKKSERVSNDFSMEDSGSIALVTGSNMSGKSTFLRTIGVSMILAYAGAPVCAQSMSLSLMQLFTSMRTEDNLEEHISSFYAELQRIKQLLELLKKKEPILFMLDEILKGTNSEDRHAGAEALIRQLSDKHVMGFVSTHDLALGKLANELPNIINYSFNSEIKSEKIIFNYKLTKGLCHSFNASKLMQQIGIKIN